MRSKSIGRARLAVLLSAALAASGCAHFQKPAFHCISQVEEGGVTAATFRVLDTAGRQIRVRSEWVRPCALNPRSLFRGEWRGTSGDVSLDVGRIQLEMTVALKPAVRLELRTGSLTQAASDARLIGMAGTYLLSLSLKWPMLREMFEGG